MQQHIKILAVLHIAFSILYLLGAVFVFLAVVGGGILSGDRDAMAITAGVGTLLAIFLCVLAVPGLLGGFGLMKRRPWARIVVLVLGALNLLSFPFGTALGIYTFWVLLNSETTREFGSA